MTPSVTTTTTTRVSVNFIVCCTSAKTMWHTYGASVHITSPRVTHHHYARQIMYHRLLLYQALSPISYSCIVMRERVRTEVVYSRSNRGFTHSLTHSLTLSRFLSLFLTHSLTLSLSLSLSL